VTSRGRTDLELYINNDRASLSHGYFVSLESTMETTRVYAARHLYGSIPGLITGYEQHPIAIPPGSKLELRWHGRVVAAFVEHGGRAVDPMELVSRQWAAAGA
jgi:hypothetical protein